MDSFKGVFKDQKSKKQIIEIPDGHEIDVLTFKKIELKLPMSFDELPEGNRVVMETEEEKEAKLEQKEEKVKPKVGDLVESNGKMKFYGAYSSLFLTKPTKIIETHEKRLNRFEHEKGKTPKKEFLIGDLVRFNGKLQFIDSWSGLYITQENSLIVETHEERLARFDTVKSMKKRLKKRARESGWNVKKAIYLKKIEPKLPMNFKKLPVDLRYTARYQFDALPNKYQALRKLELLRNAWNGDWVANWDNEQKNKWCICLSDGDEIYIERYYSIRRFLSFEKEKTARKFAKQFKDLIFEAKELL